MLWSEAHHFLAFLGQDWLNWLKITRRVWFNITPTQFIMYNCKYTDVDEGKKDIFIKTIIVFGAAL
jgi:hypothetical protein